MIIAVGDLHLSTSKPLCRTDDNWLITQRKHLDFIAEQVKKNNAELYIAGDIFDTPTVAPVITNMMIDFLKKCSAVAPVHMIAGNHDLPYHSIQRMDECSFGALRKLIGGNEGTACYDFDTEPTDGTEQSRIVMLHHFSVPTEADVLPNRDCYTADKLIELFPRANIIITGDNHIPWTVKRRNKLIVNCGTLMKRNAIEAEHKCGVWLIDNSHIEAKYIDYSEHNDRWIDTAYLDARHEREESKERYENLLQELRSGMTGAYDFPSTLEAYVNTNRNELGEDVSLLLEDVVGYVKEERA